MKENLKDFDYEQIVLGEKDVDNSDLDQDKITKILESNNKILKKYPPDKIAASIKDKMTDETTIRNLHLSSFIIPISAAAVLLVFFTMFLPLLGINTENHMNGISDGIRLKGSKPLLFIYKEDDGQSLRIENNSIVHEKDRLQLGYDSAGAKYGVIFSIDGRGTVTLQFPENIYSNTRLDNGGKVLLPFSYELDNAPFFERFFFVTSDREIDSAEILEKAGRIARGNKSEMLNLPPYQSQQSITLFKEEVRK